MFITHFEGMEALSLSVVVMAYTRLVHDIIVAIPKLKELFSKIPGPKIVKERTPWLVAGYTVDGVILLLVYFLYNN